MQIWGEKSTKLIINNGLRGRKFRSFRTLASDNSWLVWHLDFVMFMSIWNVKDMDCREIAFKNLIFVIKKRKVKIIVMINNRGTYHAANMAHWNLQPFPNLLDIIWVWQPSKNWCNCIAVSENLSWGCPKEQMVSLWIFKPKLWKHLKIHDQLRIAMFNYTI